MYDHRGTFSAPPRVRRRLLAAYAAGLLLFASVGRAEVADALKDFRTGEYAKCIDMCTKGMAADDAPVDYWLLKTRAELTTGRYEDALKTYQDGVAKHDDSLQLRLLGVDALHYNGKSADADALLKKIIALSDADPDKYSDAANRAAVGEAMLKTGTDARRILDNYLDRAKRADPKALEPLLATGALGLEKHDNSVAFDAYNAAETLAPDDPDVQVGLARCKEDDDPEEAAKYVAKALGMNPRHVDSLLIQADSLIFREQYQDAGKVLAAVLTVNPKEPRAWALLAVMANLTDKPQSESASRDEALADWKDNPAVDNLIGEKLSQNYRFAEGAAYQKKALAMDGDYLPAKFQLAQDLLRLGKEDDGWKLVAEVFKKDPYNVTAYNLMTLKDEMDKMDVITTDHFIIHMDKKEHQIYGQRVVDLLERARAVLTAKYAEELPEKTTIEIFPTQADFAVRTFGLPGGEGFLGVCFGPVVTVNSPAAQGEHLSNWEAILWHEFCHTVTLTKSNNKMPRWLSEGISVYEERQANPSWGEQFTPAYREAIVKGALTPVSQLSQAFLSPPDPEHLAFAYFEASMFVDYAYKHYGPNAIRNVLSDLGAGVSINDAFAKDMDPVEKLDKDFAAFMNDQAAQLAPKVDWAEPGIDDESDPAKLAKWVGDHPNSYKGLLELGQQQVDARKWNDAKATLQKALDLFPNYTGDDGPLVYLGIVEHELGDKKDEADDLQRFAVLNSDAIEPRLRLMQLDADEKDWNAVKSVTEELLAINPLIPAPHRSLAEAAEELGDRKTAITERRVLLLMDPLDLAEQHFRLAKLLYADAEFTAARREIDMSLEEAPRYRAAYSLLVDIKAKMDVATQPATAPATAPAATLK